MSLNIDRKAFSLVLAGVLLAATPASPHHSNVAYEVTKVITITGVVKEFRWVNPHTWLYVIGRRWQGRQSGVGRRGPRPRRAPPGRLDEELAQGGRDRDRRHEPRERRQPTSIIARVTKADGTILSNQPALQ